MLHLRSLWDASIKEAWLAIGAFDGVHRGHQKILKGMVSGAHQAGSPAVVLTFSPHPGIVLGYRQGDVSLTTVEERAAFLGELGIDVVITHPFDVSFSKTPAREFILTLKEKLGLRQIWVGPDFTLGRGKEGTVDFLMSFGNEVGFTVNVVEKDKIGGEIISSSRIRGLLLKGDVADAATLLGRNYRVSGKVVPGDQRGRTIGIPTANLEVEPGKLLPCNGVYACRAWLRNKKWPAAVNIGTRPTFKGEDVNLHVEAHLVDYPGDEFYGEVLSLDFVKRLRSEIKFPSKQELMAQINYDISQSKKIIV